MAILQTFRFLAAPLLFLPTVLLTGACSTEDGGSVYGSDPNATGGATTGGAFSGAAGGSAGAGGNGMVTGGAGGGPAGGADGSGGNASGGSGPVSSCGSGGLTGTDWVDQTVPFEMEDAGRSGTETGTFAVLAPSSTEPLPLVICLHGDEGTYSTCKWTFKEVWDTRKDFIAVAMQNPWQVENDPNASNTGWDNFANDTAAFFYALAKATSEKYAVDLDRVSVTGLSAGSWWMGQGIYRFQDLIASAQFSCGASVWYDPSFYEAPSQSECKIATRIEINSEDFLYEKGQELFVELNELGHVTESSNTACGSPGHCCGNNQHYGFDAMAWFDAHPLCGSGSGRTGCQTVPAYAMSAADQVGTQKVIKGPQSMPESTAKSGYFLAP